MVRTMQNANSTLATAAIVSADVVYTLLTVHRINTTFQKIEHTLLRDTSREGTHSATLLGSLVDHLTWTESLRSLDFSGVRVLGSSDHQQPQSIPGYSILSRRTRIYYSVTTSSTQRFTSRRVAIVPMSSSVPLTPVRQNTSSLLIESLRLLFSCEYLLLAEYVECVVPLLYTAYLAVLLHLPNLQFYEYEATLPQTQLMWTLFNYAIYSLLEFASLLALQLLLRHRLNFSPFYQLAFVLETQFTVAQSKLALWMLIIPQLTLAHFGADFSALLRWLQGGKW